MTSNFIGSCICTFDWQWHQDRWLWTANFIEISGDS